MKKSILGLAVIILLSSCATTAVSRVESGSQADLSGYWNARDVQIVCDALIDDCLNNAQVNRIINANRNRKPVVIIGRFRNESSEHIDTSIISSTMERAILNSGKLDFVAGDGVRQEITAERAYQSTSGLVSDDSAAMLGREIGADFMLTGSVKTIVDRADNKTVRSYFVSATLTNIETGARLWIGQNNEVTKVIVRKKTKF